MSTNIDPTALAAHEIGHLTIDTAATGIAADDGGWSVVSTDAPVNEAEFLSRQSAGIIAEIVLRYGLEVGSVMAKKRDTWRTAIGEDDNRILDCVSLDMLVDIYDRCAPTISRILNDVGKRRLTAIGHRILEMESGEIMKFNMEAANA